ncbi:MAG TPA: TonB-dependent receptor [Blastocatellia bacterium]|nr:TonB-dependent receptor [Blastocatellia bacterium]
MKNISYERLILRAAGFVFVALSLTLGAKGQVTTGSILGTVKDNSGASVKGARVTVTDLARSATTTYTTDDEGNYNAPFLIPGAYSVAVEAQGFKKAVTNNVVIQIDQKARIDFNLEVGQIAEVAEITAAVTLVRTESSELGEVIEERAVKELPLNGRNFAQLVYLTPGVTPGQSGENLSGASTFNPRASSNFNALGHHANSNGWIVDGIDNNEYTFNTVIIQPTVESVREFKALTGTFSSEFGRGAGVVVVSTKSGSNDFHFGLFEFLRNDKLDAFQHQFVNPRPAKKPPFRRNQFGGYFSGPLTIPKLYNGKNKTFIFADYAGLREVRGQTFVNSVPTAKTRLGDFSELLGANLCTNAAGAAGACGGAFTAPLMVTDTNGQNIQARAGMIFDPLTTRANPNFNSSQAASAANPQVLRSAFAGNVIPAVRINPVGLNVASIYPLPLGPGLTNNFTSVVNRRAGSNAFTVRLDHEFSERDKFFARYSFEDFSLDAPQGQASCCLPTPDFAAAKFDLGPFVAGIQNTTLRTQGLALNHTHTFSPTLLLELRAGFARTNPRTVQSDFGHAAATSLGIQGINISDFNSGIPNIDIADLTGLSGGPNFLPVNPKQTHYQFDSNIFYTLGRHTLKLGYHMIIRKPSPFTQSNTRGQLTINNNFARLPFTTDGVAVSGTGAALASLLLGYVNSGSRGFLNENYYLTNKEFAGFAQDDIKLTNRLTVNLGLRYEVYTPDVENRDLIVNFDPQKLRLIYAGEEGYSRSAGKETHYKNFGPRVGFAWDLFGGGKTVLRGGYGISYFPEPYAAGNLLGQNIPLSVSQSFTGEVMPANFNNVTLISRPFPTPVQFKPTTTAALNAVTPAPTIIAHEFSNLTPYAQSYSLNVERALTSSVVLEVGYAGSRGIHIPVFFNVNEVQPGSGSNASRRLIQPLNNIPNINIAQYRNSSSYNSLQTKVVKRFSGGSNFLFSYTFGKSLDYGGSPASGGGAVGGAQTYTNVKAGRGPSGYDVKHRAVFSSVYEVPFGKGKRWLNGGPLSFILGGWQTTGIVTATSGRPFTVFLQNGVNNGAPSWPNRIGDGRLDNPTTDKWFDTSAFVAPTPNTFGNSSRGALNAPGNFNVDGSLAKSFAITEKLRFQFRFEAYNLFNSPYFGFPNANIGSPNQGQIRTTLADNRSLQGALKIEF